MKIHKVQQYSPEWYKLRIGIPTASQFEKIVTPKGVLSKQARKYAFYLIAEQLLQQSLESVMEIEYMERGHELEEAAMMLYEFENDAKTEPVGFITTDDGKIGCSPDRIIVAKNGALELKCPSAQVHVGYEIDGFGDNYFVQSQGQAMVGEFEFVDRYSYHPELPPVLKRTPRDEKFIKVLRASVEAFNEMKEEMTEIIRAKGFFEERDKILRPHEAEFGKEILAG